MKTKLKIISILAMAFFSCSLTAQYVPPPDNQSCDYTVSEASETTLKIDIRFSKPEFRKAKEELGDYFELHLGDCYNATDQGKPNLPVWNRLIEIPAGATYKITAIPSGYQTIEVPEKFYGMELIPVQPPQPKSESPSTPWTKDTGVYNSDAWFGYDLASVGDVGIMRHTQIGRLSISPVEYHPGNKTLRFTSSVSIIITFEPPSSFNATLLKETLASPYIQPSSYTINGTKTPPLIGDQPVHYLILSDTMFQQTLQPFIEWKIMKGFKVTEVYKGTSGVGTTATAMKTYLEGIYNGAGPSTYAAPSFLLIVGDVQQIPTFSGIAGNHSTDLYYAEYTNDIYPELLYGRFSATTTSQLVAQIDKTLHVEKFMMSQPSYLDKNVLVSGYDAYHSSVYANGQMRYVENTYMNAANNLFAHTYLYPTSSGKSNQIIQNINEGVSLVNYSAHGNSSGWADPAFSSTMANSLTNTGRYPTVISNACETNTFSLNQCFGEALLRAQDKGAVGHIGASASTYWDEDFHFAVGIRPITPYPTYAPSSGMGFYDRLFHTHGEPYQDWVVTQGGIIHAGNMSVTQAGSFVAHYWEVYHLMGDPSLMPYLGAPPPMNPIFPPALPVGLTQIVIQSNPYVYVAVTENGTLHGAGITDGNGFLTLKIEPFLQPATAKLVMTGQNLRPFFDSIHFVVPSGPFVLADSIAFRDVNGNLNNLTDAGETIQMDIRLHNFTGFDAGNVKAILKINDPYIDITDSIQILSTLQGLSTNFIINAFNFVIADYVPDQHVVSASIIIVDSSNNLWKCPFSFVINSARITIRNIVISDQAGNGNGKVDPGENFDFIVNITNNGNAELQQVNVSLSQESKYVQLISGQSSIPVFMPGQTYPVYFAATASSLTIPKGSFTKISIKSTKNNYADSLKTYVMLDVLKEDFETSGFTSFPWTFTGSQPWFITTETPYEGTTCVRSGVTLSQSATSMSLELPVIGSDSISFFYKVSSEAGYDFLKFNINQSEMGRWSGDELTWKRAAFPVDTGLQVFTWTYEKDYSWEEGYDCAWIDYIVFPATSICIGINNTTVTPASFNVYPNPTSGNLVLRFTERPTSDGVITILGADGRKVQQEIFLQNSLEHTLSLNHLAQGIYFVLMKTGNVRQIRKVIKL